MSLNIIYTCGKMVFSLKDMLDLIARNIESKGNPLGIDPETCSSWAQDLGLGRGGETIIYTSCMYQMAPYIARLTSSIERLEKAGGIALKLGKALSSIVDLENILKIPSHESARFSSILKTITRALKRIGIDVGYLYDEEPYSGSLLYELGVEELFISQTEKAVDVFRRYGVRKIITIDPHTYFVLSKIYPKYVDIGDIEITHYLEIVSRHIDVLNPRKIGEEYTIHDPCLLARYMGMVNPQRHVASRIGVRIREPERSGSRTRCCGGPLEAVSPKISRILGSIRIGELKKHSKKAIVMCPICFSNLSRSIEGGEIEIYDIAELLSLGVEL
jgi:Fe-S oxidoreductase